MASLTVSSSASVLVWIIAVITCCFLIGPNLAESHRHHQPIPILTSSSNSSSSFSPRAVAWDNVHRRFILGGASTPHPSLNSISDTGNLQPLLPALPEFPANSAIISLVVDAHTGRLLAVVSPSLGRAAAVLGIYDLRTLHRLSLNPLPGTAASAAADFSGNVFITDPAANLVYKVNPDGVVSVLTSSSILRLPEPQTGSQSVGRGLTGIAFIRNGLLLVAQKDSGRIFRVDAEDGVTRSVLISSGNVTGAIGVAVRRDGNLVVVGERVAWLVRGRDNWAEASIVDELKWEENLAPIDVVVREGEKVYVLFKRLNGEDGSGDEDFLQEIEFPKEAEGEHVWAFVLLGIALGYVIFWRLQMGSLMKNMNKKTN